MQVVGDVIGAWAGLEGAKAQETGATNAAGISADATRYATDVQKQMFDKQVALQEPWRVAGESAINYLSPWVRPGGELMRDFTMADYTADPGYAFRLGEGQKALERSAAARGGLLSGAALKGITRFGQDYGANEYQNAYNRFQSNQTNKFNRLAAVAGVGQTANNALQGASQNYANTVGNLTMQGASNQGNAALVGGQARASAYQGIGNALGRVNWGNVFGNQTGSINNAYGGYNDLGYGTYGE